MNSSLLAHCQFHVGLIRSFLTYSGQPAHYMAEIFIQANHYILMALGFGKVGTFPFLK